MSASGDLPYALQRWLSDMDAETPIARHQADVAETYPPVPDMYRIVAVPRPRHTAHFGESEADNDSVLLTDMEEDDRVTLSETDSEAGGVAILLSSDSEMDEDLSVTSSTDQDSDMGPVDDPEGEKSIVSDYSGDADVDRGRLRSFSLYQPGQSTRRSQYHFCC